GMPVDAGTDAGTPYCSDLTTDNANCGVCGKICAAGTYCSTGGCRALSVSFPAGAGVQTWIAPVTAKYRIIAQGGSGGTGTASSGGVPAGGGAGLAAVAQGTFTLPAGTALAVMVGAAGSGGYQNSGGAGGGGSFVVASGNVALVVAG